MQIKANADLRQHHTFAISQTCQFLVEAHSVDDLMAIYQKPEWAQLPKLLLGKGSNVLFTAPFEGVVIVNRLHGKQVSESDQAWHLRVAGGEDWPSLVAWCVEQGYSGLENLALIPGCAGSAPIQNIGAYGVELKDVCDYVDVLDLESFTVRRLSADECQFGYRDSIFKRELQGKVAIVALGLKLNKAWQANIDYGPLRTLADEQSQVTAQAIFERVCQVRREKLPDPNKTGNAGSFFKNPLISLAHFERLKQQFPAIVAYPSGDKMKVAAGWLIDQCQLKGFAIGGAQVHQNQALVLINADNAQATDVVNLAAHIRDQVFQRYQIALEHEVRFMGANGETTLERILENRQ
ncbi:UDP-N-acetylmuramate dehydrogenase [Vibrio sp. JPW-9-11-11]|uniref:UDP-N-acetylmuramate dehydrogenase n=1 Tax=Vibrio sp. JPW-9-11-11 TaxID=1416532 RepID=UPI001593AC4D|nr:UDP-N-acetylmuramate dehydrogenase [Vibrio sp. JPW-9-11-11]NVD05403.1 UDP-N-acetylmuramate dehydrogenase [Vibrio sp. JPW-9-11-11]